jgi:hypothetical protein
MIAAVNTLKLAGKSAVTSAFVADAGAEPAPAYQLAGGPRWVSALTTSVC